MAASDDSYFHLLCAADARYGPWTGVMMSSVLAQDHGRPIHVHLLSDGVHVRDLRRMAAMAEKAGGRFSAYEVGAELATLGPLASRMLPWVTRAAVARLLFDRFVPLAAGRLIYCDSDITCVAPLRDLWLEGLGDALVGAVPNGLAPAGERAAHNQLLGLPASHAYANSGVLLIDVARWRDADIGQRACDFIVENADRLMIPDQDALNAVLGARIKPLPAKWNFQVGAVPRAHEEPIALIHYAGPVKPWFAAYRRGFAAEFRRAKRASPWRWTPPVLPLGRVTGRWLRSLSKRYRKLIPSRQIGRNTQVSP